MVEAKTFTSRFLKMSSSGQIRQRSVFCTLLFFLLLIQACKSTTSYPKEEYDSRDSVQIKAILDTMHIKALMPVDTVWCDSVLSTFNDLETFKRYPDLVYEAYKWNFIAHGFRNAEMLDSFKLLMAQYPVERLKPYITYVEARIEVSMAMQNVNESATLKLLEAYEQFQSYKNTAGIALCCKWLGFLHMQSGQYEKSISYSKKALELVVDLEEDHILRNNIYRCYDYLEQYDSADFYIHNSVSPYYMFYTIDTCKYNYYLRGMAEETDEYFTKNFPVLLKDENQSIGLYAVKVYCSILLDRKRFREAEKYIQMGLVCNDTTDEFMLYKIAYRIYDSLQNYRLAYKYLQLDRALDDKDLIKSSQSNVGSWLKKSEYKLKEQKLNFDKEMATQQLTAQRKQKYYLVAGSVLLLIIALLTFLNYRSQKLAKEQANTLLLNILPEEVADELKQKGHADARHFDNVTVFFSDFKSFTTVSEKLTPQQLVDELHECFSAFDNIISKYGIEKIKTVGDAYLCVSGLPTTNPNHAEDMVKVALEIQQFMKERKRLNANREGLFDIRVGLNSGSVVAGIVGVKKFAYDIWGDTVNTAARMEQNGEPGKINISEATYVLVKDKFNCEYRGEIEAKNKGKLKMFFVEMA